MIRLPTIAAILLGAVLPASGAAADCPVPADLDSGIAVRFDDGALERYVRTRPAVVRLERSFDGAVESIMDLGHGVYVLTYMDVFDGSPDLGSRMTTSFPGGLASLQPPAPGARWTARTLLLDRSGPTEENITVAWGALAETEIGGCRFTVLDGIIAYQSDNAYFEGVTYLPEFGFGFLQWAEDETGRSTFTALSIEAG